MAAGPERQFQTRIENLATFYGWRHYHAPENRPIQTRGGRVRKQAVRAGWPDLTLWHPRTGQMLYAELKAEKGRVTPAQAETLAELEACGCEVHIWRPSDWDAIQDRLTRHAQAAEVPPAMQGQVGIVFVPGPDNSDAT